MNRVSSVTPDPVSSVTDNSNSSIRSTDLPPTATKSRFIVKGMTCGSCAAYLERNLLKHPKVQSAVVNFATSSAVVVHDAYTWTGGEVAEYLSSLGYETTLQTKRRRKESTDHNVAIDDNKVDETNTQLRTALLRKDEIHRSKVNFFASLALTLWLWVSMVLMDTDSMPKPLENPVLGEATADALMQCVFTTIVVVGFGREFFINAVAAARHGTSTMDTLVALGVGSAYASSVATFLFALLGNKKKWMGGVYFFDSAASLVTFILLGRFLELSAKKRTTNALVSLMDLQPQKALLVRSVTAESFLDLESANYITAEEVVEEVNAADVLRGDVVKVVAGARMPVDGIVLRGESLVDEALITGESVPVVRTTGSNVVAGSINQTATLYVRAEKVGAESTLAQIIELVKEAQETKPEIQKLADTISRVFVPCVLLFAFCVLGLWLALGAMDAYPTHWRHGESYELFALTFFIATLVIACPCAMGLATPTAVMVTTGVGAKLGVLIKGGHGIELAAKTTAVVFDKTGTLTKGKLSVCEAMSFGGPHEEVLWALCQKMVVDSTHPVSASVRGYLQKEESGVAKRHEDRVAALSGVETIGGRGLVARWTPPGSSTELNVAFGSAALLESHLRLVFPVHVAEQITRWQSEAKSVVLLGINDHVAGAVTLRDELKPEAARVIKYLRTFLNVRVYLVSGDNAMTVRTIAEKVGIDPNNVVSSALPHEKAAIVSDLQADGDVVMFVGDGINDSPALAKADCGVALGAGTDVAIDSADVVLMRNNLKDVATVLHLGRVCLRRIKMNLFWAFGYNLLALPLASGLALPLFGEQMPPMYAGLAMIGSSLTVLLSSLHLKLYEPPR